MITQATQRVRHGRLGQVQHAGSGTHAAMRVDRVQDAEQIQVKATVTFHGSPHSPR
jgi:hypothetical protein